MIPDDDDDDVDDDDDDNVDDDDDDNVDDDNDDETIVMMTVFETVAVSIHV